MFKFATEDKFNLEQYQGVWYEIARMPTDEPTQQVCVSASAKYTLDRSSIMKVVNTCYQIDPETNRKQASAFIIGKAVPTQIPGKLELAFDEYYLVPPVGLPVPIEVPARGQLGSSYLVQETDYQNYSIVANRYDGYFYYLQRTKEYDGFTEVQIKTKAEEYGFDSQELIFSQGF